jgi:hypothetical protein
VQIVFGRNIVAGFTGTLPIGVGVALFASALSCSRTLAVLLPLFLLIPAAVVLPAGERAAHRARGHFRSTPRSRRPFLSSPRGTPRVGS